MTLADDVDGVYLAWWWRASSAKHTRDPGLTAGRVPLLRVSETSGVETHTHHAVPHVQSWLSGGVRTGLHVTSSVHRDIIKVVHCNAVPHERHALLVNGHLSERAMKCVAVLSLWKQDMSRDIHIEGRLIIVTEAICIECGLSSTSELMNWPGVLF